MKSPKNASDAKWYFERAIGQEQEYYDIFFEMCKKFNVSWGKASEKQKAFISEVTRVSFEHKLASRGEISRSAIRPSFSA